MFGGSNPLGWIFQAENFFSYYDIPPVERVTMTAFHFVGDALSWYQHQASNDLLGSWVSFKRSLELRFGPSTYENHEETQQTSSVAAYHTEFEKISNRVIGLSPQTLRNCFISGLKPDIQSELAILKPTSLHDAYGLARLLEDKLNQPHKPKTSYPYKSYSHTTNSPIISSPSTSHSEKQNSNPTPPLLPTPPKPLPFTKLSPEAIQQRQRDELCFRCPDKYFPGHKCSPPQFLLIVDNDDDSAHPASSPQTQDVTQPPEFMSLSDVAFFGMSSLQTLHVTGYIRIKQVTVLIDCSSTHNIIQPRIAASIHLLTQPLSPFSVMVGNGQFTHCEGHCPNVKVQLHKTNFHIPFFIFPIQGADIILGISWLSTLSPIMADFSIPELSFTHNGITTTLRGDPLTQPVSPSSRLSIIHNGYVASIHALQIETTNQPSATSQPTPHNDPNITTLLQTFEQLFKAQPFLPPKRPHDHHIPLINENQSINVKPYHYPHFQKQIMTQLISEMLKDGIIRPSQSPFSSPVLLVKKRMAHGIFVWTTELSMLPQFEIDFPFPQLMNYYTSYTEQPYSQKSTSAPVIIKYRSPRKISTRLCFVRLMVIMNFL